MKQVHVLIVEAFTDQVDKGNPAGVVLDASGLSETSMQSIAKQLNFNETVFVIDSSSANLRLRYFAPNKEVALCGHGTIAAIYAYMEKEKQTQATTLTIETMASTLICKYDPYLRTVTMTQGHASFKPFKGSIKELTQSIGINEDDLDTRYPIMYGSTGVWTLLVPIKHLSTFNQMIPSNNMFAQILEAIPNASIHPFTLETIYSSNDMHGRHFSATGTGSIEDSITGTACGVMGAYYISYIKQLDQATLNIEQGQEMDKDGLVQVHVLKENEVIQVEITGSAIITRELTLLI